MLFGDKFFHIPNGIVYVSECVPDSANKIIWITSAYISKNGSKGQLLNIEEESSPQPTPEASFDSDATTTVSISHPPYVVNSELSEIDKSYLDAEESDSVSAQLEKMLAAAQR